MQKIKFPTIGSIMIPILYIIIISFKINAKNLDERCLRIVEHQFNNKVALPVFVMLILLSIFTIIKYKKELRNRIFDIILICPILFHVLLFTIKMIFHLF